MAAPITGPTTVIQANGLDGPGSLYIKRLRYKQKKPYDLPAPYLFDRVKTLNAVSTGMFGGTYGALANASTSKAPAPSGLGPAYYSHFATEVAWSKNFARAKFVEECGEIALMAVNWAERKQAYESIADIATRLYRATVFLKRGNLKMFLSVLSISSRDRRFHGWSPRKIAKEWSNIWLAYHFGWEPLVKDIHAAIETVSKPFEPKTIEVKGKTVLCNQRRSWNDTYTNGYCAVEGKVRCKVGATVKVDDQYAYVAGRWGVVNPAVIAWELIPFSFVVDWFSNVGDFLNQGTDLLGISITNPYHTVFMRLKSTYIDSYKRPYSGLRKIDMESTYMERFTSIPDVTLGKRPPYRLSVVRAATAISLLVQQGFKGR